MRVSKKILSRDAGRWLQCCWTECENPGFDMYKSVFHDHPRTLSCENPVSKHIQYTFCSASHKDYYDHSHIAMGMHSPGFRGSIV